MNKKTARMRRATKHRAKSHELKKIRLVVYRSSRHIYVQLIDPCGKVICSASTLDKSLKNEFSSIYKGSVEAAKKVGQHIGRRANEKGISDNITFDRSGYKYHGRVKALAESAREYITF